MKMMFILVVITIFHPTENVIVSDKTIKFETLEECQASGARLKARLDGNLIQEKGYNTETHSACIPYIKEEK